MNTLIELFDDSNFNNLLGTYLFKPKKLVVFIDRSRADKITINALKRYVGEHLIDTELKLIDVNLSDLNEAKKIIEEHLNEDDAVLDITGTNTLMMALFNDVVTKKDMAIISYNNDTGKFGNVRGEAIDSNVEIVLSVGEWLEMRGAKLISTGYHQLGNIDAHDEDIQTIWEVNRYFFQKWNKHTAWIQMMDDNQKKSNTLEILMKHDIKNSNGNVIECSDTIIHRLKDAGILHHVYYQDEKIGFTFKNQFIKTAMFTAGIWLELFVYSVAKESGYFDDVHVSAAVDWDGVIGEPYETKNEIDVVLSKGARNAFISCKTCPLETNMLNEISMLRDNLGSPYTRGAIITSYSHGTMKETVYERSRDLKLTLIDGDDLNKEKLLSILKELVA